MPERRELGAAAAATVLRVLGPVAVTVGGVTWRVGPRKARELLALLALRPGQVISTERLTDGLWDGHPPHTAPSALRTHVREARRALGDEVGEVLVTRAPGYALRAGTVEVDADRAGRLLREASQSSPELCVALCDEALELWSGEPYADVALRQVEAERHRLVELRLTILELRAGARATSAPPDDRYVADLAAMVTEAPRRERFTELLMLALYRLHRQPEALDAYRRLREALVEHLGLEPSRPARDLEAAVLRRDPSLEWRPPAGAGGAGRTGPAGGHVGLGGTPAGLAAPAGPFVGRARELATLHDAVGRPPAAALVLGEAGIGKSRLVTELAAGLLPAGTVVVAGSCDPERSVAFRPFVEVLRALRAGGQVEGPSPLLAARQGAVVATDERLRFFTTVSDVLDQVAGAAPGGLVVVLEDLHWVDDASAEMLRYLLAARPPLALSVVATARTDEPAESVTWARLRADFAGRDATVVALGGLTRDEVAALVSGRDDGPTGGDVDRLHALTGGNPLLVTELWAETGAAGWPPGPVGGDRPAPAPGSAPTTASAPGSAPEPGGTDRAVPVPRRVAAFVQHRLLLLPEPVQRALEVAALAGERADSAVVGHALGTSLADVYGHRAEAVAAHLLVDDEDAAQEVRFRHALVREAITAAISPSRRRQVRLRLADALREAPATPERDVAIARHLLAAVPACPLADAAGAAHHAADAALDSFAFEQAAELADQVIAHPRAQEVPPRVAAGLLVARGTALVHLGRLDEAGAALEAAATHARELDDPHLLAAAALGGDPPDRPTVAPAWRVPLLEEALARLDGHDCAARVRTLAALARDGATPGRYVDRRDMADEAVTIARRLGSAPELFTALTACHLQHLGRPGSAALSMTDELVQLSQVTGDAVWATRANLMRARERFRWGDMSGAEADIAVHRALAERTRRPADRWQAHLVEATVSRIRGDLDGAERAAAAARELAGRIDVTDTELTQSIHDFFVHWHRGALAELAPLLDRLAADNPGFPVLRLAAALAWVEAGDPQAAAAGAVVDDSPHDELFPTRLALGALVASAGGDRAAAEPLARALAPSAGRFIVTGALAATWGPADRYRSMLARLQGDAAGAVGMAEAAVALADAAGASVWSLWSRAELAAGLATTDPPAARKLATGVAAEAGDLGLGGPAGVAAAVLRMLDG